MFYVAAVTMSLRACHCESDLWRLREQMRRERQEADIGAAPTGMLERRFRPHAVRRAHFLSLSLDVRS